MVRISRAHGEALKQHSELGDKCKCCGGRLSGRHHVFLCINVKFESCSAAQKFHQAPNHNESKGDVEIKILLINWSAKSLSRYHNESSNSYKGMEIGVVKRTSPPLSAKSIYMLFVLAISRIRLIDARQTTTRSTSTHQPYKSKI